MLIDKVVHGLESCILTRNIKDCYQCPYFKCEFCIIDLMKDALEVIKNVQKDFEKAQE